jgi:hypothetical protein
MDGQYNATPPTIPDKAFGPIQLDAQGNVKVNIASTGGVAPSALTDATANPTTDSQGAWISAFNGTTWDRVRSGATAATSTPTGFLDTLPFGKYNATPPSLTDGQSVVLQVDSQGNLKVTLASLIASEDLTNGVLRVRTPATADATDAWTNYNSGTSKIGTAGQSVKAGAGRVRAVDVVNTNTTTLLYLLICNKASAPVANDAAIVSIPIPANTAAGINSGNGREFGGDGIYLSTGIAYAISTTPEKVTLPGTSDCVVSMRYL